MKVEPANHLNTSSSLKADVENKVVIVPETAGANSLGASILAGIGVKIRRDFQTLFDLQGDLLVTARRLQQAECLVTR
jgi:hypothetical protein